MPRRVEVLPAIIEPVNPRPLTSAEAAERAAVMARRVLDIDEQIREATSVNRETQDEIDVFEEWRKRAVTAREFYRDNIKLCKAVIRGFAGPNADELARENASLRQQLAQAVKTRDEAVARANIDPSKAISAAITAYRVQAAEQDANENRDGRRLKLGPTAKAAFWTEMLMWEAAVIADACPIGDNGKAQLRRSAIGVPGAFRREWNAMRANVGKPQARSVEDVQEDTVVAALDSLKPTTPLSADFTDRVMAALPVR